MIAAACVLGLALRIGAARGGLWLDEAWSALYARDAGTPLAVLLRVNHDNNHHLNTLWLQLVGFDASPLLQRALSIACGTASIGVAAAIGARRSAATGVIAALLFAVSPLLVTYGSEARGYAPMVLALMTAMLIVIGWLKDPRALIRPIPMAVTVLFGMLAQLTMVFGVAALAGWIVWESGAGRVPRPAPARAARMLVPLLLPAIAVLVLVFLAGHAAGTGVRMGNFSPFTAAKFDEAINPLLCAALGYWPDWGLWSVLGGALLAVLLTLWPPRIRAWPFHALAILVFPALVCLLSLPNSGFPRYYLVVAVSLLLLIAVRAGQVWRRNRLAVMVVIGAIAVSCLIKDAEILRNLRADPSAAMREIARRAPRGASVGYGHPRSEAVIEVAAAQMHYPLRPMNGACPPADFLYIDVDGDAPMPASPAPCGVLFKPIASARNTGLSGMNWTLYARAP